MAGETERVAQWVKVLDRTIAALMLAIAVTLLWPLAQTTLFHFL